MENRILITMLGRSNAKNIQFASVQILNGKYSLASLSFCNITTINVRFHPFHRLFLSL